MTASKAEIYVLTYFQHKSFIKKKKTKENQERDRNNVEILPDLFATQAVENVLKYL